ncbi:metal-dependent hydrolase [Marinobacter confluentis]|uniref:Metal-dependent hydrolase n=1 Tax=Marinobacter confluentis TaxID=1697557 RepID=A0A4Z1BZ58_9GAMM|nr:metal-dependent hydrolase [Marinobacter confluentis]TGN38773.1 metal-dependent hydrolase [Marinobacter confluentis]
MDSITQAALGASLAGAVGGKTLGRSSLLIGAALGTLPDLDVVIDYGTAIANFSQHRGFSHSLLVLFPLAILLAWLLNRWRPALGYQRWLFLTGLILITHPLLDAFTTYGTQIFWPFGEPVAISSIFIIDPLYTLPLLVGILLFVVRNHATRAVTVGLALSTLYLGWTLAAQQIISSRVDPALAEVGLEDAPRLVQPMPFTTMLWRITAQNDDQRVEIITGFLDDDAPLLPEFFPRRPDLAAVGQSTPEGQRLEWFTDGFTAYGLDGRTLTATDIRLGIPGAHPFVFTLGKYENGTLTAEPSGRLDRPEIQGEALGLLWQRITGQTTRLCLASLSIPEPGASCS